MKTFYVLQCQYDDGELMDLYLGLEVNKDMKMVLSPATDFWRAIRFDSIHKAELFQKELNRLRSHSENPLFIQNNKLKHRITPHNN